MQLYLRKLRSLDLWLLAALTDVGVMIPWSLVLTRLTGGAHWYAAVPGLWLGVALYTAAALSESRPRGETEAGARQRVVSMLAGMAGAYAAAYWTAPSAFRTGGFSLNPALGFLPVAGYLWLMGALSVTEGLSAFRLRPRYPFQVFVTAAGLLILARIGLGDPGVRVHLVWSLVLVLVAGLLSLYVARGRLLRSLSDGIGESPAGAEGRNRLGPLVASLLVATVSISFFGSGAVLRAAARVLTVVAGWAGAILWLLVSKYKAMLDPAIEWLLTRIAQLVTTLLNLMRSHGVHLTFPFLLGEMEDPEAFRQRLIRTFGPSLVALAVFAAILVIALFVHELRRIRGRQNRDPDEEILNLGFWSNLLADLRSLFAHRAAGAAAVLAIDEPLAMNDPRMLFRRLQAWGAALGRPRSEGETPSAYGGALGLVHPAGARAADTVVSVYNQARYGAALPDAASVRAAATAVATLEQEMEMPG